MGEIRVSRDLIQRRPKCFRRIALALVIDAEPVSDLNGPVWMIRAEARRISEKAPIADTGLGIPGPRAHGQRDVMLSWNASGIRNPKQRFGGWPTDGDFARN